MIHLFGCFERNLLEWVVVEKGLLEEILVVYFLVLGVRRLGLVDGLLFGRVQ